MYLKKHTFFSNCLTLPQKNNNKQNKTNKNKNKNTSMTAILLIVSQTLSDQAGLHWILSERIR